MDRGSAIQGRAVRWVRGKFLGVLFGIALMLATMAVVGGGSVTTPASADSGFCGVRVGQYYAGGREVYVIRNKCGSWQRFAVYLPNVQRRTVEGCKSVGPYEQKGYWDFVVTDYWYIVNC
jgi:hypothetical protein